MNTTQPPRRPVSFAARLRRTLFTAAFVALAAWLPRAAAGQSLDAPSLRAPFSAGAEVAATRYSGDFPAPQLRASVALHLRTRVAEHVQFGSSVSAGRIAAADGSMERQTATVEAHARYYARPQARTSPVLQLGAGLLSSTHARAEGLAALMGLAQEALGLERPPVWGETLFPYVSVGVGAEVLTMRHTGVTMMLQNQYALIDGIDGVTGGGLHDNVWTFRVGVSRYF